MNIVLALSGRNVELDVPETATVLDALELARTGKLPDLVYRHSCHHGSCGTCGALINGKPGLMCLTSIASLADAPAEIQPLPGFPVIQDLAISPAPLSDAWPETTYLKPSGLPHGAPKPEGDEWIRFEACIECGICMSACPVRTSFLGPAALAAVDSEREKHPERHEEMLEIASAPEAVAACRKVFACSRACPQAVAPGRRIENLRRALAARSQSRKET